MPLPLFFLLLLRSATATATAVPQFHEAPAFRNAAHCTDSPTVHIAMTIDTSSYLRGSIAAIFSVLHHSSCPENTFFHFLSSPHHLPRLQLTLSSTFPSLVFSLYSFPTSLVLPFISPSLRPALDSPLNYARLYLPLLLPHSLPRVLYLDSDLVLVDDPLPLFSLPLPPHRTLAAPLYCHANFSSYFTPNFWSSPRLLSLAFPKSKPLPHPPCYFNTGVMVIDLARWRRRGYTRKLEMWMRIQKKERIYELGSLPPFLLVFAGEVEGVDHRWNQHGLGGDNVEGRCRDLHPGPVSLLHWSGKGKPWLRIDGDRACPLDSLWAPYDLVLRPSFLPDSDT